MDRVTYTFEWVYGEKRGHIVPITLECTKPIPAYALVQLLWTQLTAAFETYCRIFRPSFFNKSRRSRHKQIGMFRGETCTSLLERTLHKSLVNELRLHTVWYRTATLAAYWTLTEYWIQELPPCLKLTIFEYARARWDDGEREQQLEIVRSLLFIPPTEFFRITDVPGLTSLWDLTNDWIQDLPNVLKAIVLDYARPTQDDLDVIAAQFQSEVELDLINERIRRGELLRRRRRGWIAAGGLKMPCNFFRKDVFRTFRLRRGHHCRHRQDVAVVKTLYQKHLMSTWICQYCLIPCRTFSLAAFHCPKCVWMPKSCTTDAKTGQQTFTMAWVKRSDFPVALSQQSPMSITVSLSDQTRFCSVQCFHQSTVHSNAKTHDAKMCNIDKPRKMKVLG